MHSLGILLLYLGDLRLSFSDILFRDALFIAPIIAKHAWYWSCSILQNDSFLGWLYDILQWSRCGPTKNLYIVIRLFLKRAECNSLKMWLLLSRFSDFLSRYLKSNVVSRYIYKCFWKLYLTTSEMLKIGYISFPSFL